MKYLKKLIIIIILGILLITFLPLYERHTICGANPQGGCWKEGMNLIHYLKYKRDYKIRSEELKTKKMVILTFENNPKIDGAGIVVKTLDGKFISRNSLGQYHDRMVISLDNGEYIFEEYIGGEFIKSFNFNLQLNEDEKTISKTITW